MLEARQQIWVRRSGRRGELESVITSFEFKHLFYLRGNDAESVAVLIMKQFFDENYHIADEDVELEEEEIEEEPSEGEKEIQVTFKEALEWFSQN